MCGMKIRMPSLIACGGAYGDILHGTCCFHDVAWLHSPIGAHLATATDMLLARVHHGGGGGATPRVLGRQLPLPPPTLGAFGEQLVAKGVTLRRPWAPKAPDAT